MIQEDLGHIQINDEGNKKIPYLNLKESLVDFLVNIKNIKFKELIDQHFTIAIYRVNRLLSMLDSEFDQKYGKNS